MDLHRLRTLVAVDEVGSLTGAARARHLTQPAVSLQIKALEEEIGAPLFRRRGRGVQLTQAGQVLVHHARLVLRQLRSARAEVESVQGVETGRLRLGVTDAAATALLSRVFLPFHRRHPGVEVAVEVSSTAPLVERLKQGAVDLVLGTLPVVAAEVQAKPILAERLRLVAPTWARGRPVGRLLKRFPFIAYPRTSTTRRLVDEALRHARLTARPMMEIGRPPAMVALVAAGAGLSVLPDAVTEAPCREGRLVRIAPRRFHVRRELGILLLRRVPPEPAVRAFADLLEKAGPSLARGGKLEFR